MPLTPTTNNRPTHFQKGSTCARTAGFSILEMTIALMVLMVGLLALASAVGYALMATNRGRNVTNTKLLVASVLEQMENLRNTRELTFGQIANAGSVDNQGAARTFSGFQTGWHAVSSVPGPDGIYGTSDDMLDPGPDAVFGTADDFIDDRLARAGFSRQIVIQALPTNHNLKKIQVTLKYPGGDGVVRTISGTSYLNNDARTNFRR